MGKLNLSKRMQNVKDTSILDPSQYQQEKRKIKKLKEINDTSLTKPKESPGTGSNGSLCSAARWCGGDIKGVNLLLGCFRAAVKHFRVLSLAMVIPGLHLFPTPLHRPLGCESAWCSKPMLQFVIAENGLFPFLLPYSTILFYFLLLTRLSQEGRRTSLSQIPSAAGKTNCPVRNK